MAAQDTGDQRAGGAEAPALGGFSLFFRFVAWSIAALTITFLINIFLVIWMGWPGIQDLWQHLGWFGYEAKPVEGGAMLGWAHVLLYAGALLGSLGYVLARPQTPLRYDSALLSDLSGYIIRACFWAVLLVGLADTVISFLRVEGFLEQAVGDQLATDLGRSEYRGNYLHYPLVALSFVIAYFLRGVSFIWLALLVVVAEMQIVIARFIFSYEQAFMGDLVRFWYAALFLFASAYTLLEEGHVRVDVFYTRFSAKTKGLVNCLGSLILGIPLCWTILVRGMWEKSYIINSPLLSYEVTQQGFGMYTKYMMAGFLAIFAISMMIQFASYVLQGFADWRGDPGGREPETALAH